jgi:hypothetical protein
MPAASALTWPPIVLRVSVVLLAALTPFREARALAAGPGEARPPQADTPAKPDFRLTAQELYDEFVKDKAAAHKKFGGKVIEVGGVVRDCKASGPHSLLVLDVKKNKDYVGFDDVYGATEEKECWARHGRGQKVKLRGKWGGPGWVGAAVTHAAVVEAGPNPTVLYPAAGLAKEWGADSAGLARRYQSKHLIVEGEVLKKEERRGAFSTVYLKGTAKAPVACNFGFHDREQAQGLKVGQKVKVFGELSSYSDTGPALTGCLVVTRPTTAAPAGPP